MTTITPRDQRMLDILTAAAEAGQVCPTNDALCTMMGMNSCGSPPQIMNKLVKAGMIAVERFKQSRIVTIVATGKATAGDRGDLHHSEAGHITPCHRLTDDEARDFKRELTEYLITTDSARVRLSLEAVGHGSGVQNILSARNPNRDTVAAFRDAMRAFPDGLPALKKASRAEPGKRADTESRLTAEELERLRSAVKRRRERHVSACEEAHRQKYGSAPFGKPLAAMPA